MSNSGWIKIYRKILENPVVTKDAEHFIVWIYLLLNATHKERQVVWGSEVITLKPGQLITGRKVISSATKVNESKVKRILNLFKKCSQIDQQTNRHSSLITILSWDDYQKSDQQMTNKWPTDDQQMTNNRPTDDQQMTTNKNVKKKKNVNNDKNAKKPRLAGDRPKGDELDAFITRERKKINGGK